MRSLSKYEYASSADSSGNVTYKEVYSPDNPQPVSRVNLYQHTFECYNEASAVSNYGYYVVTVYNTTESYGGLSSTSAEGFKQMLGNTGHFVINGYITKDEGSTRHVITLTNIKFTENRAELCGFRVEDITIYIVAQTISQVWFKSINSVRVL